MISLIRDNLGTIVVGAILGFIVIIVIRKMIIDKREGKNSCGCGCDGCPSAGVCHKK